MGFERMAAVLPASSSCSVPASGVQVTEARHNPSASPSDSASKARLVSDPSSETIVTLQRDTVSGALVEACACPQSQHQALADAQQTCARAPSCAILGPMTAMPKRFSCSPLHSYVSKHATNAIQSSDLQCACVIKLADDPANAGPLNDQRITLPALFKILTCNEAFPVREATDQAWGGLT